MVKSTVLTGWINKRIERNKNCIGIINGPTGSGKTYAAIDFALTLSKDNGTNFTIKDNLDFSFVALKKKMNLKCNDKPGTVFIFEEVGAIGGGAASREWQSKANTFFFSFMQTARHKNQILLMTCPQFSYLDKGVRQMCHLQITMLHINPKTKKSVAKPFIIQINPMSGKMYPKYLRYRRKGRKTSLKRIQFDLPPKRIVDEYEKLKLTYTKNLDREILEKKEKPQFKIKADPDLIAYFRSRGLTQMETAIKLGVTTRTIQKYEHIEREANKNKHIAPLSLEKTAFEPEKNQYTPT